MYSLKNKENTDKVREKFLVAFTAYIEKLVKTDYIDNCTEGDCYGLYVNYNELNSKIAEEIGINPFPLKENKLSDEEILDLVEAIYQIISIPEREIYNKKLAEIKYEYTIKINNMFSKFKMNYLLKKGKVISVHSKFLNELFIDDLMCDEKEVIEFLEIALHNFNSRKISDQRIALNKLVDAFERIKSLEDKDKKKSVQKIVNLVDADDLFFNEDMKRMTKIANNEFMIRHSEVDKMKIDSPIVLEYLFYLYYNSIRAILLTRHKS